MYEWLRLQAFQTRRRMNTVVVEAVRAYRTEVENGRFAPDHRVLVGGAKVTYPAHVDNEMYEWLRTTAFHQRSSMTTLIVAALVQAQMSAAG